MNLRTAFAALAMFSLPLAAFEPARAQSSSGSASSEKKESSEAKPQTPLHATILKDATAKSGLWTIYQKNQSLYWEIQPSDYSSEYIVLISISRGIGRGMLLGGMSWNYGDDWVWQFRKVGESVHVVRKNVRFKAAPNTPEARAVASAYTDSVLFSLPIMTKGPKGGDLVDLTSVFMSDLPQIGRSLPGFTFAQSKSSWAAVKAFEENVELQVAATYASSGNAELETVPDSRGATINVHYSISKVPSNGYQPRLADDRVGYFLSVVKDFSAKSDRDQFVRYINRWDLQKADPSLEVSPPKKQIEFYIEKTVPYRFRKSIYDGIYEWNKALEKAGFSNAIVVKQQEEKDDRDPEDIRYNFFRWITSNAGFAMCPSRVNPYTGQILDADIIFDADYLTFWKQEFETFTPRTIAEMTGGELEIYNTFSERPRAIFDERAPSGADCTLAHGRGLQLAFGSAAIMATADPKVSAANMEKLIQQGIKETTMHEVGHALGLRHNFKGSKWLDLKDLNDEKRAGCLVATVMDYNPTNVVPKDWKQGDYYATTIGPYDYWAIEYGYKPLTGGTHGELPELKKIAARSGEPALAYATDEDITATDPDPNGNKFDLGSDPVAFARMRLQLVQELLPGLADRMTREGEDYTQVRKAFNLLVSQFAQSAFFVARYVGGLEVSRSHKGDKDAKPPITLIDAKTQRDALAMLEETIFSDKTYDFPPELLNRLGWTNWDHWGLKRESRAKDFPVHEFVLMWQERIMAQLLSSVTLKRIHDAELKAPREQDVFTTAELIQRLTNSIFSEVETVKAGEYTNRKPAISSLRRNLQRSYLDDLSKLALGSSAAPQDCHTVAYVELLGLQGRIDKLLKDEPLAKSLDTYSKAHLLETSARIAKVLDARFELPAPTR